MTPKPNGLENVEGPDEVEGPEEPAEPTKARRPLRWMLQRLRNPSRHKNKILKRIGRSKLPVYEMALIRAIIKLGDITARDIMIPRVDVVAIERHPTRKSLQKHIINTPFSRTPVYEDTIDNLKGVIHIRELFKLAYPSSKAPPKKIDLARFMSSAFYVPESRKIKDILSDLQAHRTHMAIIVDEYGGFSGLLTMEDILEEIIGDVQDEFDSEPEDVRRLSGDSYSIDARISLSEVNKRFNLKLQANDIDTLGGFLIHHQGHIPRSGQTISINNINFKILSKRRNSITRIRMNLQNLPNQEPS